MSARKDWVHPDLKLVPPRNQSQNQGEEESGSEDGADTQDEADPEKAAAPGVSQTPHGELPFYFEKLPLGLQGKILALLLHKQNQLIHCISRLDPFVEPEEFPSAEELGQHRSGLKKLFYWGGREVSIVDDGVHPNEVLALLSVNKRFYFLGVHIFYGSNTFAFSSLGELGRFCQGSGIARIARIQHIELLLTGSQYLTAPPDERGRTPFSRRTYPLTWLADMYRLKTFVVHINETGKQYIRRGYENSKMKDFLAAKSAGQPNVRMTRSLRYVQGMDWFYQLRGLEWIRFYDFNKALAGGRGTRVSVKDWSFLEDITNTSTMPKNPKRQEKSELENLEPLFSAEQEQNWTPNIDDWALVKSVFIESNGRCSYDEMRVQRQNRDADLASYLSNGGSEQAIDSSSNDDDDDDDNGVSNTSSPSGGDSDPGGQAILSSSDRSNQPNNRRNRRRQQRSDSPLFVSNSDADDDTDGSAEEDVDVDDDTDENSDEDSDAVIDDDTDVDVDHITNEDRDSPSLSSSDEDGDSSPPSASPIDISSDDDSDATTITTSSFNALLSGSRASRTPSSSPPPNNPPSRICNNNPTMKTSPDRRASTTSTGLFMTPNPSLPLHNRPEHARRASTTSNLFVSPSPGPSSSPDASQAPAQAAQGQANTHDQAQAQAQPHVQGQAQGQADGGGGDGGTGGGIPRRESTGLFVTPDPSSLGLLAQHEPKREEEEADGLNPLLGGGGNMGQIIDLTRDDDDDDDDDHGGGGSGEKGSPRCGSVSSRLVAIFGEDSSDDGDDDDGDDSDMDMRILSGGEDGDMDSSEPESGPDSDLDSDLGLDSDEDDPVLGPRSAGSRASLAGRQSLFVDTDSDAGSDLNSVVSGSDIGSAGVSSGGRKRSWGGRSQGGSSNGKRPRLGI